MLVVGIVQCRHSENHNYTPERWKEALRLCAAVATQKIYERTERKTDGEKSYINYEQSPVTKITPFSVQLPHYLVTQLYNHGNM